MSHMTAWLLSAYHTESHAGWSRWLTGAISSYDWQLFSLPGRHFRWRIRGNPLSWLDQLPGHAPDLLVATSMVDLATLRGLRPDLASTPCLYYFHENQFAYPRSEGQHHSIDPQMVQLYGALAADQVAFNSTYNLESFLSGIELLGKKLPDHFPKDLSERIREKSQVLPVPIQPVPRADKDSRLIVWNHRWEYDKAPQVFVDAIELLLKHKTEFRLALLGARSKPGHPELERLRKRVPGPWIVADNCLPKKEYRAVLGKAQIVVSTAIHEFQGIAMLEAVSAGASPLVPDALCYPEQYPPTYRYPPGDAQALAGTLHHWLTGPMPPAPQVEAFYGQELLPHWQIALSRLLN